MGNLEIDSVKTRAAVSSHKRGLLSSTLSAFFAIVTVTIIHVSALKTTTAIKKSFLLFPYSLS